MFKRLILLFLAVVVVPAAVAAQEPEVKPGARIRVWTTGTQEPVIGTLQGYNADSLSIFGPSGQPPTVVSRTAVSRLEISKRRSRGRAVLNGLLAGTVTGALAGLVLLTDDNEDAFLHCGAGCGLLIGGVVGLPLGAVTGLVVGPGQDRWHSARLATPSPASRLRATPLSVTLRF